MKTKSQTKRIINNSIYKMIKDDYDCLIVVDTNGYIATLYFTYDRSGITVGNTIATLKYNNDLIGAVKAFKRLIESDRSM